MPKYNVLRDTFVSHLGRLVRAGETIEFEPPVLVIDGKKVPMRIADNLELAKPSKDAKGEAGGDGLV